LSCQWETAQHKNWQLVLPLFLCISISIRTCPWRILSLSAKPQFPADDSKADNKAPSKPAPPSTSAVSSKTKTGTAMVPSMQFVKEMLRTHGSPFPNRSFCYKSPDVEREQLFDGSSDVRTPRKKSTQEILTKYKFKGVISFLQHSLASISSFSLHCDGLPDSEFRRRTPQDAAAAAAHAKQKLMERQEKLAVNHSGFKFPVFTGAISHGDSSPSSSSLWAEDHGAIRGAGERGREFRHPRPADQEKHGEQMVEVIENPTVGAAVPAAYTVASRAAPRRGRSGARCYATVTIGSPARGPASCVSRASDSASR
jgi:hypothetical protein